MDNLMAQSSKGEKNSEWKGLKFNKNYLNYFLYKNIFKYTVIAI